MEEKIRSDISKRLGQIKTIGPGSSEEGTAYLILQMFDVAKRRLSNKGGLKLIYLNNPDAPEGLRDVVSRYVKEEINQTQVEQEIDRMKVLYERILVEEYGFKPSKPSAIFMK
ncbi:MAG: hypothetical protein ACE5KE_10010 [Methanosarcinales archaeon]